MREGNVNSPALYQAHVKFGGHPFFEDAGTHAIAATRTAIHVDIPGVFTDLHTKISRFSRNRYYLREGIETDTRVICRLNHPGSNGAGGAVEGRKCLVQLGHVAADAGIFLYQVHEESLIGDIEGGLHAGNAGANDKDLRYSAACRFLPRRGILVTFHRFIRFHT